MIIRWSFLSTWYECPTTTDNIKLTVSPRKSQPQIDVDGPETVDDYDRFSLIRGKVKNSRGKNQTDVIGISVLLYVGYGPPGGHGPPYMPGAGANPYSAPAWCREARTHTTGDGA